ncbi:MAG: hypothetical protein QJT81_14160 [Candidatus Thiothrix putei]|uniref:Arc-like DNA binding domain-containing protein n=2 Tax=Thiothrix TaxID=1030 RepID=A0A1H4GLJ2_9GAMM|nr:hypothetical protein [Thiothrix caldifontis]WGZ92966.1 MAG: hypothetical protein QJT81_14160 [Candidatus Thiothrix putei]SEB10475.1 hypothetical protein SAMN05660964_03560 [Thiothrix caldifontis]
MNTAGKDDMKEKKLPRSIRLDPEMEKWVIDKAKAEDRSFNAQINRFVKKMKELEEQQKQGFA